ncbi:MAG: hypothetical protein WAX33_04370 [Rectinemataceae bacterium]
MIRDWKATAVLASPLAGDAPKLDALLQWELARRLGLKHHLKLTRNIPLSEIERVPVPIYMTNIAGHDVFRCSDPIIAPTLAEWTERQAKRIDTDLIATMLAPEYRKSLLTASGPYKMLWRPTRVRLVGRITWFFHGDRKEVNKLLKSVVALGKRRGIGYGLVDHWEYEEAPEDWSIYAMQHGKPVLMKTIPAGSHLQNVTGYTRSFGGAFPPYWHPETFMEIAIPC